MEPMDQSTILAISFPIGRVVITPAALDLIAGYGTTPLKFLQRHCHCDWGDLDHEDIVANNRALYTGERLLSDYNLSPIETVWIITEWDRSYTTILLPSDY